MATESQTDTRKKFVPRILPWLLAAAALVVYGFTLTRWVSLFNLGNVVKVSGWSWAPEILNPVFFLATLPFHWLPTPCIPLALNIFSAVCAALTLGLLARSVALLPQDRADAQRTRERSDFSLLTIRSAWLPPVFAVLVCGLQLTFWECATNCTGDMLDLLLFAFVVWSLLEYRLDEREGRLFLAAAVYGAGMAESWGMTGFLPLFVVAILWIRGLGFFNLRFLRRMLLCWLAGASLYLLLPLLTVASDKIPVTFWEALKYNLSPQYDVLKLYLLACFHPQQYFELVSLMLAYLSPLLVLSIRWKSSFGDNSRAGLALAGFMIHMVNAIFFGICVWMVFDPPFSPREKGFGLTFYYLIALSIGYYTGYFLLVFGRKPPRSQGTQPLLVRFLNRIIVVAVWVLAVSAVAELLYKNAPSIRVSNADTFRRYTSLVEEGLPAAGGILLSDDSRRLFLTQAALARDGRDKDFLFIETQSLPLPQYYRFLHAKYPDKWPGLVSAAQTNILNPMGLVAILATLAKTNEIYYLHPSYGYYFEVFYPEPHGLVYRLKTLPNDTLLPPPPDKNEITENDAFWSRAETQALAPIERDFAPSAPGVLSSWSKNILTRLHIVPEQNKNAVVAGAFYSQGLDFWGVQLQRAGHLTNAAADFDSALKLNPDNVVAQINLQFNEKLRAGGSTEVDLSENMLNRLGTYSSWNDALNENGPFDEPSFCFEDGLVLAQNRYYRQAIAPFARVREFAPENLAARLWLGQLYVLNHLPDRALEALRDPMEHPEEFSLTETNSTQLDVLAAAACFQKNDVARGSQLLETEITRHPDNDALLVTAAQFYLGRSLFTNALAVVDQKLKISPDDPNWLFTRGYICIQLKKYDAAIAALTRVLFLQKDNPNALFNRAIANLDSGKLDDARADYEQLRKSFNNSAQVAYGLGEIAWRRHDTNEAVKNYELYLASANTNTSEATNIIERLRQLKGRSP